MDISQEEKEYKWFEAAKSYEKAIQSSSNTGSIAAESWRKIGSCYELASRQTQDVAEFKKLRQLSVDAYQKAAMLFKQDSSSGGNGKSLECLSIAEYTRSWLASNSSERKRTLEECLALGRKAAEAFKHARDDLCYGRNCNHLSLCLYDLLGMATTWEEKGNVAREAISNSNESISVLSALENKDELLFALSRASLLNWYVAYICEHGEEWSDLTSKSLGYSEKAISLSKEIKNPYLKALAMWAAAWATSCFTEKTESSLEHAEEMLQYASQINDNYLKGIALNLLATIEFWLIVSEPNPEKQKRGYEEIIKHCADAIKHLQLVCQDSDIADVYLNYAESYSFLALDFAVSRTEKLAVSRKAIELGEKGFEYAIRSGSPDPMRCTLHGLSKAYQFHSRLEPRKEKKLESLRNALGYRKEYLRIDQTACPPKISRLFGIGLVYAAQIEADLAQLEEDEKSKAALMEEAVVDMDKGVTFFNDWIRTRGGLSSEVRVVAGYEDAYAGMLNERYSLTKDKENLAKANNILQDAAEKFKKVDLPSRVAECYWKIAGNLDLNGDYQKAAENFEEAFEAYNIAAQQIHQLSEFYLDYATYMKAWGEIQTAKLAHNNAKYSTAMKHYQKASDLLDQSKMWSYLSSNFQAWSLLERAEDFSRKENCSEAIKSFERATKTFQKSKKALQVKLDGIEKVDEKDLVIKLIQASDTRVEYSNGRIAIEEAKILDKQGDHIASSAIYGSAAQIFRMLSQVDPEQIGKETEALVYLCQAWEKMNLAEARSSPTLYEEAAKLFKLANEHTSDESASLLALAHSNFCKALEAETQFEMTRNAAMYTETKKYMNAAANYYLKAGFETSSEYAKATQRLFDAYVYMDTAKKELDPEKEAKYYLMAEKVLQVSAESFTNAKHSEKTGQVQRLLKKVREERELAVSLSELFHAPSITASTAVLATIRPSEERAVGLERFEHADIQAKLIQQGDKIRVGEGVNLKLQIANVGKEAVLITKVENLLPTSFELVNVPENWSREDSNLITKAKRLCPLEMDEIEIAVRPFKKGVVEIKPRIICIDDAGHPLLYEPKAEVFNVLGTVLQGRMSTGHEDLDDLLLGGIPEGYAVIITSSSSDERDLLIESFLQAGIENSQTTFHVTVEPGNTRILAEQFQSNFYLFVCNPRADVIAKDLPNVFKLKGVESLTDIDIALTKTFRTLNVSQSSPKRACIEIVSDVLLQHRAVITRKWLSGLLPDLRAKGFTTLAVINPHMHPPEEVQAILGLFEGEIRISEKETAKGVEQVLRIRKLYNQRYLENELILTKERLEI